MPSQRNRDAIDGYTTNFCLRGPGGSLGSAKGIMRAAAAVLRAGGAGVFIDNSGLSHGSDGWHALTGDPGDGGVFWAFVTFVGGKRDNYTVGMHVLGYRDAIMPRSGDDERDRQVLGCFLGYSYRSGAALADGHVMPTPACRRCKSGASHARCRATRRCSTPGACGA